MKVRRVSMGNAAATNRVRIHSAKQVMKMKMRRIVILVCILPVALAAQAWAQDDVIKRWDFEQDNGGWVTFDDQATLARTNEADAVFRGEWSLEFTFPQRMPDQETPDIIPGVIIAPVDVDATDVKSLRFAVAPAYSVPVLVVLNEKGGASYMSVAWAEAGRWNECELGLADFVLGDDSHDENNRLDADQIETIGFADGSLFTRVLATEGLPIHAPAAEQMTLWLDEIVLSAAEVERPPDTEATLVIDRCDTPTIQWLPVGGDEVHLGFVEAEAPEESGHLSVRFVTPAGTAFALIKGVLPGRLEGTTGLALEMRVELGVELAFVVEESGETRYMTTRRLPASAEWQQVRLPLSEFDLAPDATDPNFHLDPHLIRRLIIADFAGVVTGAMSANTWSIRNLTATR